MSAYTPGTRVVCPDPDGGTFIGTVAHVDTSGGLTVTYSPTQVVRASVEEVRPVMPRDRADLERWGRWWYLDSEVVEVAIRAADLFIWRTGVDDGCAAGLDADWRGPVAPPPEVRS